MRKTETLRKFKWLSQDHKTTDGAQTYYKLKLIFLGFPPFIYLLQFVQPYWGIIDEIVIYVFIYF